MKLEVDWGTRDSWLHSFTGVDLSDYPKSITFKPFYYPVIFLFAYYIGSTGLM